MFYRTMIAFWAVLAMAACGCTDDSSTDGNSGGTAQNPGSTTPDPGGTTPDPGGTTPDPGGTTPDPGGTTPDPGGTTPDPGGTTPDPGGTTPDPGGNDGDNVRIRLMAANITSGTEQTYNLGHGTRIFQAMKPDIVMIQEFNYTKGEIREFVDEAFGTEYKYYRGTAVEGYAEEGIPNGIISKYEIIESGQWQAKYLKSNGSIVDAYKDRQHAWAVIDIPGDRELLAVSVHLKTDDHAMEMTPLAQWISEKQAEGNYYVVLGGDFNTKDTPNYRSSVTGNKDMTSLFYMYSGEYPVDQRGNEGTNAKRAAPLDWVLFSKDLEPYETPVVIGSHKYANGHVFDSRVYEALGELTDVPPVEADDSGANSMQHMAVIRDVAIPIKQADVQAD